MSSRLPLGVAELQRARRLRDKCDPADKHRARANPRRQPRHRGDASLRPPGDRRLAQRHVLTDKARSDLHDFAASYLRYGHGALILSTPSGGANAERGLHARGPNPHVAG